MEDPYSYVQDQALVKLENLLVKQSGFLPGETGSIQPLEFIEKAVPITVSQYEKGVPSPMKTSQMSQIDWNLDELISSQKYNPSEAKLPEMDEFIIEEEELNEAQGGPLAYELKKSPLRREKARGLSTSAAI
eukprot:TRINITY_DN4638_c0_g1_i1.p1 TRINITY_DN4638_c0_g1~~TRINITY_DN4638_c0_g1_i1.p1  ORF type:complete len:132 (+),score=27.53 TRINITY_DN4638_c0_g1_i1:351-746(+)